MDDDTQTRADERLARHLERTGAPDPRAHCRRQLRELRGRSEELYERAVGHYRASVLPRLVEGPDDPLAVWVDFGVHLATLGEEGRTVVVDGSGRARPYEQADETAEELVLHLPDSRRARPILVALPHEPSPAQRATHDLLVAGRQRLEAPQA